MAENFKKGDIVRMDYDAYIIADVDKLYDTTNADNAKEAGFFNEKYKYAPLAYVIGSGKLFKVLDEAIASAKVGEEVTVEVACEDAAGPKNPKLIETFPLKEFYKQEIRPFPGLEVRLGDRTGTILSVGAGRVKVDFNNPLAGKDLKYVFKISEEIKDDVAKAECITEMDFGTADGFKFEVSDKKVSIYTPDIVKFNQNWLMAKFRIVNDMRESLDVDTIEFIEVWEKAPAKE